MADAGESSGPRLSLPSAPNNAPGIPENFEIFHFGDFSGGLNTKDDRSEIAGNEMSWCDNFMPVGRGKLWSLPYPSSPVWNTPEGGTTIGWFDFYLNSTNQVVAFIWLTNSHLYTWNTVTNVTTLVDSSGKFPQQPQLVTWSSNLVILVTNASNGYFIWDGTNLYGAGNISPTVTISNGGTGYTSMPIITPYGGSGTGTTFSSQVSGSQVIKILATSPGSGYGPFDYVALAFSGGGSLGTTAIGRATLTSGQVTALTVVSGGSGYTSTSAVSFYGGGGFGASATPIIYGQVQSVTVTNGGSGYTSAPTIVAPNGTGATFTASINSGIVTAISVTAGGSGYYSTLNNLSISGGGGTGATGTFSVGNGNVSGFILTSGGSGYASAPTVVVSDPNNPVAVAAVNPMPFGIGGTTVETYSSRIWVANGRQVYFTSPGDPTDFGPTNGGGSFVSNDSFLNYAIIRLIQNNGALYLIGNNSVNYITGVQTSGTPPLTTFTNQNIDPNIGTPFVNAPISRSKAIIFYNFQGVFALYGGTVEKISDKLDGLFQTFSAFFAPATSVAYSSSLANIYGNNCYCGIITLSSQFLASFQLLVMWDGTKWWTSTPLLFGGATLTFVKVQQTNSVSTTWATDGTYLYMLFNQVAKPSNIPAQYYVAQSRLEYAPGTLVIKKTLRVWMNASVVNFIVPVTSNFASINLDAADSNYTIAPVTFNLELTPPANPNVTVVPNILGNNSYNLLYTDANQAGYMIGATVTSNNRILVNSVDLGYQQYTLII